MDWTCHSERAGEHESAQTFIGYKKVNSSVEELKTPGVGQCKVSLRTLITLGEPPRSRQEWPLFITALLASRVAPRRILTVASEKRHCLVSLNNILILLECKTKKTVYSPPF